MKAGEIIRYDGLVGVVTGATPNGKTTCLIGGEIKRLTLTTTQKSFKPVEIIDLNRDELENALALMQAFVRELVEDSKSF